MIRIVVALALLSGVARADSPWIDLNLNSDPVATPITEAQALPGDVVIFNSDEHIGIYLGGGLLIQAPEPGTPVNIVPVWTVAHHFGRILPAGE